MGMEYQKIGMAAELFNRYKRASRGNCTPGAKGECGESESLADMVGHCF
jgi:hypothetical protein